MGNITGTPLKTGSNLRLTPKNPYSDEQQMIEQLVSKFIIQGTEKFPPALSFKGHLWGHFTLIGNQKLSHTSNARVLSMDVSSTI
jgi:hypothetical protein